MKTANILIPDKNVIMPTKKRYLFRVAMKHSTAIPKALNSVINRIYKKGLELSEPVIYWQDFPVEIENPGNDKKTSAFPIYLIPSRLEGSSSITLFASTLGSKIDQQIKQFIGEEKILEATLLDAWASESVEALNKWFDGKLRARSGKGTMRFSPGYDDLPITYNNELMTDFLKINAIVADKETGILTPKKSTICLIGWLNERGEINESR
ncbi:MAG: methionine synthase [Candidatus Cloacimonetes bacterium]|nr:methionine synthase [Candidatus Cloacimonadota bacterium]